MRLLTRGNKERTQEPTAANRTSSRSHALLMASAANIILLLYKYFLGCRLTWRRLSPRGTASR